MNAHQNIFDAIAEEHLRSNATAHAQAEYYLPPLYKDGIRKNSGSTSPLSETREMVNTCVGLYSHIFKSLKSPMRVYIKTNPNVRPPKDVRGLVLFTEPTPTKPTGTTVIPMKLSPSLVRIGETDIFLDTPGGAKALLDVIRAELDAQIKPAKSGTK